MLMGRPCFPAGLPDPIWAAALPLNWDRPVNQLLQDLSKDHTLMVSQMRLLLLGGVPVGSLPELHELRHARGPSISCGELHGCADSFIFY